MKPKIALILSLVLNPVVVEADERMIVEGNVLVFDTDVLIDGAAGPASIERSDVNLFGDLVMTYPEIDTVIVAGAGGSTTAAYDIAHKIREYGMSTVARNNCASACAIIFLGGAKRTLEKGARLGFHRSDRSAKDHREFYEENKEDAGWEDEFAFANLVYQHGQISAREFIAFTLQSGVSVEFALAALSFAPEDVWYPTTYELRTAHVIE